MIRKVINENGDSEKQTSHNTFFLMWRILPKIKIYKCIPDLYIIIILLNTGLVINKYIKIFNMEISVWLKILKHGIKNNNYVTKM